MPGKPPRRKGAHARLALLALISVLIATGCATGPSFLDAAQADAIRMAQERAQSELGCSSTTGSVVSRETLATPPPQRVSYVVVVAGCGQRQSYVVGCTDRGGGCYTGAGRPAR
jgi:hypothetical protein